MCPTCSGGQRLIGRPRRCAVRTLGIALPTATSVSARRSSRGTHRHLLAGIELMTVKMAGVIGRAERREADGHAGLGEPVHREHGVARQARRRAAIHELIAQRQADRLGAVEEQAHAT